MREQKLYSEEHQSRTFLHLGLDWFVFTHSLYLKDHNNTFGKKNSQKDKTRSGNSYLKKSFFLSMCLFQSIFMSLLFTFHSHSTTQIAPLFVNLQSHWMNKCIMCLLWWVQTIRARFSNLCNLTTLQPV